MTQLTQMASRAVVSILFPDTCLSCRMHVAERGTLCPDCWSQLHFIAEPVCDVTGTPFQHDFGERMMATPVIDGGKMYIRTDEGLYAFGVR